jgi:hypothetical protein
MSGPRGKMRKVVEIIGRERVNPDYGPGYYAFTVRLACGHVVKTASHNRYQKGGAPVVGYCRDPECVCGRMAA